MIVCPNCGRQNEDHYKFCLGCGTELTAVARADGPKAEAPQSKTAPARPLAAPKPAAAARPVGLPPVAMGGGRGLPMPTALPTPTAMPGLGGASALGGGAGLGAPAALQPMGEETLSELGVSDTRPTPGVVVGGFGGEDEAPRVTVRRTTGQELRGLRSVADLAAPPEEAGRADTVTDEADAGRLASEPAAPVTTEVEGEVPGPDDAAVSPVGVSPVGVSPVGVVSPVGAGAVRVVAVPSAVSTSGPAAMPAVAAPQVAPPAAVPSARLPRGAVADALGAEPRAEAPLAARAPEPAPRADGRRCRTCGALVPDGFKFCGECGSRYEGPSRAPAVVVEAPTDMEHPARLVLIHPDGSPGESFALSAGETAIGRHHDSPLFRNDPFLSPRHATFFFVRGQLFVRDEASLNGVFIRIKAEVELFHRDMFRIGQQLLRFEEMGQVRPLSAGAGDGTTVLGSPVRGAWGRLCSAVAIDTTASVWILRRPEEQLGRERGEVQFPEDGFVSGGHCKLVTRDGRFFLRDIGSTNGTYLRIKGEGFLAQGDLVLLGQQLFKVDLST